MLCNDPKLRTYAPISDWSGIYGGVFGAAISVDGHYDGVCSCVQVYDNLEHSGIGYVAPSERHDGTDVTLLAARRAVYDRARCKHPARWAREPRAWKRPLVVTLNPEIQNRAA